MMLTECTATPLSLDQMIVVSPRLRALTTLLMKGLHRKRV
jgi:hypothetical protein